MYFHPVISHLQHVHRKNIVQPVPLHPGSRYRTWFHHNFLLHGLISPNQCQCLTSLHPQIFAQINPGYHLLEVQQLPNARGQDSNLPTPNQSKNSYWLHFHPAGIHTMQLLLLPHNIHKFGDVLLHTGL